MILTAAARKCPKCGESLHELAQFCPACGDEQGARVASSAVPVVPQSRLRERLPLIAVGCAVVLIGVTAVWSRHRTAQQEPVSDGTRNAKTGLVKQIDPPSDDPPLRTIWPNSSLPQLLPRKAHIIEVADVSAGLERPRSLVLWVLNPKRRVRKPFNLQDLTGEGAATKFVLFAYNICMVPLTSVVGYDQDEDAVVEYPIETISNGKGSARSLWVEEIFAMKPVRPGYWSFDWSPGHGFEGNIHEEVSFDSATRAFLGKNHYKVDE